VERIVAAPSDAFDDLDARLPLENEAAGRDAPRPIRQVAGFMIGPPDEGGSLPKGSDEFPQPVAAKPATAKVKAEIARAMAIALPFYAHGPRRRDLVSNRVVAGPIRRQMNDVAFRGVER